MKLFEARYYLAHYITDPLVRLVARTPLTPAALTWLGFLLAAAAGALVIMHQLVAAAIVMLAGGLLDMLDGGLARYKQQTTRFGAFLDSTLDRLSESALLFGVLVLQAREQAFWGVALAGLALIGSLLVSYLRARAEALDLDCKVGLFTRPERVIVLALGLLLGNIDYVLLAALAVIVFFSFFTAGQRLVHVWRQAGKV